MGTENNYLLKTIKTDQEINKAVSNLAKILNNRFNNEKVVFIIIMKGGLYLGLDLARKCKFDIAFDFIYSNSYYLNKKLNKPKITYKKTIDLKNENIIIIDDLIDSGETIFKIIKILKKQKPLSISVIALYNKRRNNEFLKDIKKYICFSEIPPGFLLGYGLDYDEKYRNLNYLGIIKSNNIKE
ncbi:phosphoribosyltransferase [Candidatus Hepatoplasma crinochetorum]|uniref:Hypoxanthine-guanine phosphoribosyltransferase n=1 Tax=Candidatus Hepatoplasma crinochetorum Av TaxID=1427984 RepID=W8GIR7_9MOLU|nr:phosphoribosyltransferase family protein [Candidatus Hepatoplasma crinochetorum]AHK22137.1 Hypoxanthine phosphoribosyltransferase [Candidatus Hepatoplasma crinochetorum Av]BDV02720.1 MAG: hypoxanthine phosphoribosyltransferase [Candidatus Hepatoplasma crinochetorum]